MDTFIIGLIYAHAALGGVGLITGGISIAVKKGGSIHKKSGKVFSITMIGSALLSLFIASFPGHENLFLFLIGVFTIYMVLAGNRAITFKSKHEADYVDKLISGSMLGVSAIMILYGIYGLIVSLPNNILFIFFGIAGLALSIGDFKTFKAAGHDKKAWVRSHIGRMVGALIASVTAFLVAGLNFENLIAWMVPTVIGTAYIIFWSKKFSTKKAQKGAIN